MMTYPHIHSIHKEKEKRTKKERETTTTTLSYFSLKLVLTNGSIVV